MAGARGLVWTAWRIDYEKITPLEMDPGEVEDPDDVIESTEEMHASHFVDGTAQSKQGCATFADLAAAWPPCRRFPLLILS